jgi:flagellar hook protein FlgE
MALTSFYTALTGINNNSTAINVIGDNLSNMNTIGFKSSSVSFSEMLAGVQGTSSTGNPISIGLGSSINAVSRMNTQGTTITTNVSTDAAINGSGYFVVSVDGGLGYTRSGKFEWDQNGGLIHSDGYQILGYMANNGTVDASSALEPIEIQQGQIIPAMATDSFDIVANLNANLDSNTVGSVPLTFYDSLGDTHEVSVTFTRIGSLDWSWRATIPATDEGGTATDPAVIIGSGGLTFDSNGNLDASVTNPSLNIAGLANGADDMSITFNLRDSNGESLITNFAEASDKAVNTGPVSQNGYGASILTDISIDNSGMIVGKSSTGQLVNLAQLAIANFPNDQGLQKFNGSTFVAFPSAGDPSIGVAGTGGRGSIIGSSLEQSNVDMAQEFVKLITAQRAYQANSRIITTTDELYQEALATKR